MDGKHVLYHLVLLRKVVGIHHSAVMEVEGITVQVRTNYINNPQGKWMCKPS